MWGVVLYVRNISGSLCYTCIIGIFKLHSDFKFESLYNTLNTSNAACS